LRSLAEIFESGSGLSALAKAGISVGKAALAAKLL
jgi:hypothetical protein